MFIKILCSIKKAIVNGAYSLQIRKKSPLFGRRLSGRALWKKVKLTVLFKLAIFFARCSFLHRYFILAMHMQPRAMAKGTLPRIVIFGLSMDERKKILSSKIGELCAAAYTNTPSFVQCVFLCIVKPRLILLPSGRTKQIPPTTREFFRTKNIPILAIGNASSFSSIIGKIDVARTAKFFPALFFTDTGHGDAEKFILILHHSRKFMCDVADVAKLDNIVMLPSEDMNEACLRHILLHVKVACCLAPELDTVPKNLLSCLEEAGVMLSPLSKELIRQLLLTPITPNPPFPNAPRAVLLNMKNTSMLADKLRTYHVFSLKTSTFHTAINLLRDCTVVWVGDNVPKQVRETAARNSLPVLHFCESVLSSYGWRKSYPSPLWLTQVRGRRNVDAVRDMQMLSFVQRHGDKLNSSQELEKVEYFLQELQKFQAILYGATLEASGRKIKDYGKTTILAIWQNHLDGLSFNQFILSVAKKEQEGKILALALSGYTVIAQPDLPTSIKRRCVLLKHLADIDDYLEGARSVHVHGVSQGVEAILRGKHTVAYTPAWYTGWGLTEDTFIHERPRSLTRKQFVLASFLSTSYMAPYSFERITPQSALAFWYTRQRPDLGRFYEAIQEIFQPDSRFGVLDMRVSFHNEPDIDPIIDEHLRTSIFGHIMADMLSLSIQMPKLSEFLSLFPIYKAISVFYALILQAYYQLNYEQLDYILHQSSGWFGRLGVLSDKDIIYYYKVYHDSVIKNWFHDSHPPVLRLPVSFKPRSRALLYYTRILIMCFAYDELRRLVNDDAASCTPEWYAELLFSLYNNRRSEIKETCIEKHVEMRLIFFDLYRKARIAKGCKDFSELFVMFMHESLKENRVRMRELAQEIADGNSREGMGKDEYDMVLLVVNMLRENLEQELAYILEASLLPRNIACPIWDKQKLAAQKDNLRGQRAKKWRVNMLKGNLQAHLQRNDSTVPFVSKLARGNDISIYRHYLESAAIVNNAPTINHPKGIIFFGNYGTFFSAILPVVLYTLRKRGYAVWPMFNNHIPLNVPLFHPLAKFAYALPHTSGTLQLEWTLDYDSKRIEAVGVNFYGCFFEAITILVRRYEFDWESPDIQRQFRRLLKRTDSVVAWIHALCRQLEDMHRPPKIAVMSQFAYNLPESALRRYLAEKGCNLVHFIYYKNVANYDLVHSRSDISTRVSGLDMTLWPDCRLSFLPTRSRFEPWYTKERNSPKFLAALEQIRQNLLADVIVTHNETLDYLREQKAKSKRIICCIGRLLFDQAEHKLGGPAHEDICDWLRHSIEVAVSNPNIIVLIRPHPHESNPTASVRARQTLRDVLPREFPPNVLYINPQEMTLQSLIGIMDLAVLWLGTAAWELSALDVPCAVMSHAGYDQVPFNAIFPKSREDYTQLLTSPSFPQPDAETRLRGAACLHYVKTANLTRPYPYAFVRGSNSFRTVPWYRNDLIRRFMIEGDKNIDFVVDQITEGIPIH